MLAAPLTGLLKKNGFIWSSEAKQAFIKLNEVVTQPPVLKLHDFTHPITIECDASGKQIGAVLMQSGQPIVFLSKMLKGKALLLSMYERELLALVTAVQNWHSYLLGQSFIVKQTSKP